MEPESPTRAFASIALTTCALLFAFMVGRATTHNATVHASSANATSIDLAATATRISELSELNGLRTQVAQTPPPLVCTPAATGTAVATATTMPTPTSVPPLAAGQPVSYAGEWTVTVHFASLVPTFGIFKADGTYAVVRITRTNSTAAARAFPYVELVLRDEQGRIYLPDTQVRTLNEAGWFSAVPPSTPTDGTIIFDIEPDAHGPFILESTVDPTFRVVVEEEIRG